MSTREEREQRIAEVRAEREAKIDVSKGQTPNASPTTSTAPKTTDKSAYAIKPKKNTTPTAIKSWEKRYTNEQLNSKVGSYEQKAAAHSPVAYTTGTITPTAIRAQEKAGGGYTSRVQQLNPTPTTIRAMENQYNEKSGQSTYGRSKWTATSDDPISQAYAKGLNMWGDTKTWAEQTKQASERASTESETKVAELEAQIRNLRMLSAYGTQIWDGGVYMGRDEELQAEYDRQIAELEKQIEQQKASATSAAEEYEIAQAIYDNELQITTDNQNRDKAKARGLSSEEWYIEASATKDSAWETVQNLEDRLLQVQSYVDRYNALKGTVEYDEVQAKYYERMAERLQTRLDNARTAYNNATADLESATRLRFKDVNEDPDYAKNVTAGAVHYTKEIGPGDNEREGAVTRPLAPTPLDAVKYAIEGMSADNSYLRPAKTWTSDELKTYYYLIGADGNMTRADDYAREVNAKYANTEKNKKLQQIQEWATKNFGTGVASSAAAIGTFLLGGADMAADTLEYIARGEITTKSTPSLMEINGAITSAVSDVLNDKGGTVEFLGEERGLGDMYQVAMSVGESLASIAVGGEVGSLAMFFGSAGASGIDEALERGATPGQAITYGVLKGGIEVLTEKVSVENLLTLLTNVNVKTALQSILMQAGIEASEEGMSTLLGTIADAVVMDDKSDLNVARYYYLSLGYTMEEANKKASTEWLNGLAWDTITGALSGGLSAGLKVGADAVVSNTVGEGAQQRAAVKANVNAIVPAVTQRLRELGQTQHVDETARAIASKAMGEKTYNNWLVQLNNTTQQVYNELANAGAGSQSSTWAAQALEQIIAEREAEAAEIKEPFRKDAAERIAVSEQATPVEQEQSTVARPTGEFKASYKGQTGDVTALKKTGNSYAARVELLGGKVVYQKEENLTFDSNTQELLDYARPYEYGGEMVTEYMKGSLNPNPQLFSMEFSAAADLYGKRTALSEQAAYDYAMRNSGNQLLLTREQFGAAFRIGRQQAESSVVKTAAVKRGTGELHFGQDISYGGMQYKGASENMVKPSELDALRTLAKATGIDIYFFEAAQDMNGRYKGANGFYRNGNIYLDVHAMANKPGEESAVLLVAAHEMTHYLKENNQEGYIQLRDFVVEHLMEEGVNLEELIDRKLTNDKDLAREDALEEVIADSCEMMLEDTRLPDIMARENPNLLEHIRDWLKSFAKKIASAFKGVTPYHEEARAMVQYANELQTIWDNAMAEAVRNTESGNAGEPNGNKNSFRGYDEKTGRGIYESNFPKGTPRKAKGERILNYIQNVWSKKPITLVINNSDGATRKIKAQFDSTYSAEEGKFTDASKLMGGNKHGTSSEQRVTLDLADDYYDIATESTYNYSKNETGKKKSTHDGVKQWHYFINDILFQEYGKKETTPYRVTINVKERSDGQFVYSFNAEKQKESSSTRRTLHADDTHNVSDMSNAQTSNINIPQSTTESNSKYSKRERNNEYIEAVNAGDTKTAQRLVNEAAEEAMPDSEVRSNVGLAVVYHATYNDFTVFDRRKLGENTKGNASSDSAEESAYLGFWFNTKDLTKTNAYPGGKGVKTFLNISNPYKTTLPMLLNELENQWDDSLTHRQNAENYVDDLRDAGYDGIELTDTEFGGESYVAFAPEQIKSAEPITYDEDGNVIPLSERFNKSNPDIRYSMRDVAVEETAEQKKEREKSYADLKRRNVELERQLEHLRKQTKKTQQPTIRKGDTDKLANSIAKELGITDREVIAEVKKELQTMGDSIVQSTGEELSYTELKNTALDIADYLLQNVEVELDNGATDSYRELREYLKGTTLKVNSSEMKDVDETWRKRNFGKVNLSTKKGLPIDVAYNELTERFGEGVFPSDVYAQSDMLYLIEDHLNAWAPRYGNPYEANLNEVREYYAQEILNSMLSDEIRQTPPTYADRADAKLQKEKARTERQKEKNREQREQYEERLSAEKKRRQALDKRMRERVEQVRAEGNERLKEAVKKERTFQLQRQERAQKLKNIDKISNSLMRKLTENSGKNHVPDFIKEPVAQLLSSIDPRTSRTSAVGKLEFEEHMIKLADVIKNQRAKRMESSDELTDDMFVDFDPESAEQIKALAQRIKENAAVRKEWKLELLDLQTLQEFEDILRSVSQSINEINEFYATNSKVSDVSRKTTAFLDELGVQSKTTSKFLAWDNLTPAYFFNRLGEGGKEIFKLLTKGWGDFAFKLNEIKSFTESLYQAKEAIEANNTIVDVQLHNKLRDSGLPSDNTVTVKMSKAQIMSLYGLWLRGKQALDHILGAGIALTDIKRNGNQTITQNDNYVLTMQELTDIINDNLSAREMQIVRELVKFMSTVGAKWGNFVTQKRWGIDKFTEEHYFPISTDKRSRDVRSGDSAGNATGLYRLVNFGFTKELTPNSTNPVVIDNVFDVFANHMSDMAKYGSLALPLLDMMKWINYREISGVAADGTQYTTESVRKAMDIAYGRDAQNYLTQFIRDLNSSNEGGITGGIEKVVGRYKRAAVGANLRVALLQPTSIARAAMEISPKYIAEGMVNAGQLGQSYREAMMYSGAAMWKSQGFYDVNVNRSMRTQIKHDETVADSIVDKSMFLAELGDRLTWSQLWSAAKAETKDKAKRAGEKLTDDELMSRTADRFEEIIYLTQVMDSTLTRSQLMRSKDKLAKAYTAFMAEPTLSYNTLMGKYFEFTNEARRTSRQAAWKKLGGKMMSGFAVYVASQIFTATAESVMDAWRDDDDYMTFAEKWLDKFWGEHFTDGNLAADLSVLQKIPIVKDFIAVMKGEESGRMELEGAGSLYTALKTTVDKIETAIENGEDVGKVTNFGWIMQMLRAASQLTGIPGYNMTREVVAIWNNTIGTLTGDKLKSYKANPESEIKTAFINGYLTEEEAHALLMDKEVMGDKVYFTDHAAETKIADWTNDGTEEMYEALYDAMEAGDKKAFEAAIQTLTEDGNRYRYDVIKNARSKIKEWYVGDEHGATKLNKEMAEKMYVEFGGYSKHEAHNTVHQLTCAKVEGFNYSERKQLFLSGDLSYDEAVRIVQTYGKDDDGNLLYDYSDKTKAKKEAEKEVKQWQMVLDTQIDFDERRSAYDAGEITDAQLKAYDMGYGGMTEEEADNQVYLWKWKGGDERLGSVTGAQARRYDNYIAGAGVEISKAQYANYISGHLASDFKGDLKPGTTNSYIPNSKRNKIWAYIDTLPLTPEEKDAMAVAYAYDGAEDRSENSSYFDLYEAPWNQ